MGTSRIGGSEDCSTNQEQDAPTTNEAQGSQHTRLNGPTEIWGHPVHPNASLFPMMPDAELDELAEDIKRSGQAEPILLYRGAILDGRNRMEACRRAGVEPKTTEDDSLDERTALALVASRNIHRRHLTASLRAMIAANIETMTHGGNRNPEQAADLQVDQPPRITRAQASALVGVSERSIAAAKLVMEADPKLAEDVRAGKRSVSSAAAQARSSKAGGQPSRTPAPSKDKRIAPPMEPSALCARIGADLDAFSQSDRAAPAETLHAANLAVSFLCRIVPKLSDNMASKIRAKVTAACTRPGELGGSAIPMTEGSPELGLAPEDAA